MLKHCGKQNFQWASLHLIGKLLITYPVFLETLFPGKYLSFGEDPHNSQACVFPFRDREMALQSIYTVNIQNKKEYQLLYNRNLWGSELLFSQMVLI